MADKKNAADYVTETPTGVSIDFTDRPVSLNGTKLSTVPMRELTVADDLAAKAAHRSAAEQEIAILANLIECPIDEIKALKMRDYARLQAGLAVFY